jgi:hypothetical protein
MEWPAGLIDRMSYLFTVNEAMRIYRRCNKSVSEVRKTHGDGVATKIIKLLKVLNDN